MQRREEIPEIIERLVKKQRTVYASFMNHSETVHQEIEELRDHLRAGINEITEEFKILEHPVFEQDDQAEDDKNELLLDYFARMQDDELARTFCREAGLDERRIDEYNSWKIFEKCIEERNLEKLLEIIEQEPDSEGFQVKIHSVFFRRKLLDSPESAMSYAKNMMGKFLGSFAEQIQKCTMAILLDEQTLKDESEFWDVTCSELDEFYRSNRDILKIPPLLTIMQAGYSNVDTVIDTLKFLKEHPDLNKGDTIEVEIEPDPRFLFHSVFVCPVLKEASTPENPPMLLPCGHVISLDAIKSMEEAARGPRGLVCPTCPTNFKRSDTLRLYI